MEVSLFDLIVTKTYLSNNEWRAMAEKVLTHAARRYARRDPKNVGRALLSALKEKQPRCLTDIARGLGYMSAAGIIKLFPDVCKKLLARHRLIPGLKTPGPPQEVPDDKALRRLLVEALIRNVRRPLCVGKKSRVQVFRSFVEKISRVV